MQSGRVRGGSSGGGLRPCRSQRVMLGAGVWRLRGIQRCAKAERMEYKLQLLHASSYNRVCGRQPAQSAPMRPSQPVLWPTPVILDELEYGTCAGTVGALSIFALYWDTTEHHPSRRQYESGHCPFHLSEDEASTSPPNSPIDNSHALSESHPAVCSPCGSNGCFAPAC